MTYAAARTKGGAPNAPLFFTLHGTGGSETQFHDFASQLLPDSNVVSPRGDVMEGAMARFFRRTSEGVYDMDDLADRTIAMAAFMRVEKSKADPKRTIALGYSNGANILASVAFDHPEIVDDIILMHPLIPWTPAPKPGLAGRRILITAGKNDPICPASQTQALADVLSREGADVSLHWHDGGHDITQSEITAIQSFLG